MSGVTAEGAGAVAGCRPKKGRGGRGGFLPLLGGRTVYEALAGAVLGVAVFSGPAKAPKARSLPPKLGGNDFGRYCGTPNRAVHSMRPLPASGRVTSLLCLARLGRMPALSWAEPATRLQAKGAPSPLPCGRRGEGAGRRAGRRPRQGQGFPSRCARMPSDAPEGSGPCVDTSRSRRCRRRALRDRNGIGGEIPPLTRTSRLPAGRGQGSAQCADPFPLPLPLRIAESGSAPGTGAKGSPDIGLYWASGWGSVGNYP